MTNKAYTTQLQAGLGLIEESQKLLALWSEDMSVSDLVSVALKSGAFPNITYRRLRNIIAEGFKPRYLVNNNYPAKYLQRLSGKTKSREFDQLLFLFTCRAHLILADFVRTVYWQSYIAGKTRISNEDARDFVIRANQGGKTFKPWSESTIRRVSAYLTGCCSDFGLLEKGGKGNRAILPYQVESLTAIFLSYELHFSGLGDNSMLSHPDWGLFGMDRDDVLNELKRHAMKGAFIIQSAGEATRIGWQYETMEAVLDVITRE